MKKMYQKPSVKKVDYNFQEQVIAASVPIKTLSDPWGTDYCTHRESDCSKIFYTPKTLGINDCAVDF